MNMRGLLTHSWVGMGAGSPCSLSPGKLNGEGLKDQGILLVKGLGFMGLRLRAWDSSVQGLGFRV